ncbi:hypothetical protein X738_32590 [Mesorhizobium sp. LNHC209A00]|nr:hypothetical protein X738_32590 [Mesorhizobium sp. LNHC209A00]
MDGRVTASQMAAASAASVFPRFTYGRRHQTDVMCHLLKSASPVVRPCASLHADQASRALLEKREQLAAAKLAAHENPTVLVYTMNLKDALCEVDTDCGKL